MKNKKIEWDRINLEPQIHVSICSGEKVFGFYDKRTKKFLEICLVKDELEIRKIKEKYDINVIKKVY